MAVKLQWTNNEPYATSIEIRRSTDQITWDVVATVSPSITTYTDPFVHVLGQTYYYRINTVVADLCNGSVSDDVIQVITIADPTAVRSGYVSLAVTPFNPIIIAPSSVVSTFQPLTVTPFKAIVRTPVISGFDELAFTTYESVVSGTSAIVSDFQALTLTSYDSLVEQQFNVVRSGFEGFALEPYDSAVTAPIAIVSNQDPLTIVSYDSTVRSPVVSTFAVITVTGFDTFLTKTTAIPSDFANIDFTTFRSSVSSDGNKNILSSFDTLTFGSYDTDITA